MLRKASWAIPAHVAHMSALLKAPGVVCSVTDGAAKVSARHKNDLVDGPVANFEPNCQAGGCGY